MTKRFRGWLILVVAIAGGIVASSVTAAEFPLFGRKRSESKTEPSKPPAESKWSQVVAEVNGQPITRGDLAEQLLVAFGREHLDAMIDDTVVDQAIKSANIEVSRTEIEDAVQMTLKRLNMSRREFLERFLAQQNMTYPQYARQVVWRQLALKKLVSSAVRITEEDLQHGFEAMYGEKVKVRILLVREGFKARKLWEEVNRIQDKQERLEKFEDLCKEHSIDPATRPMGGRAQPINRHSSHPEIEKVAFSLQEGELSSIMQVEQGNLLMICEGRIPAREDLTLDSVLNEETKETVRDLIHKRIEGTRYLAEIQKRFEDLRQKAVVQNYMTGDFDPDAVRTVRQTEPVEQREEQVGQSAAPVRK